jgi:alpha-D-xyloside xylohydrolase
MTAIRSVENGLEVSSHRQLLRIEPWGTDSVRVRVALGRIRDDIPGALLASTPDPAAEITIDGDRATLVNGDLTVAVHIDPGEAESEAEVVFRRTSTGEELLAEERAHFWWPGPRLFQPHGNGFHRLEQRFRAYDGERLYGLGQHTHGRLDQKGLVLDLVQRNAEISIPFLVSSRGYGLLWNMPAVGRVEFADNGTRWVADGARQIDYWVTTGSGPAQILSRYADATGHPPLLPDWATGFWQCKLRYRTQEELMSVVREHKRRGLPMSVIITDFFHWTHLGDWKFDPAEWPDPAGMVKELADLGVRLMVSIWPTVSPYSENYRQMEAEGLLVGTESGVAHHAPWKDKGFEVEMPVAFYDSTNPRAREFVWSRVRENYYNLGVKAFWIDACEPEVRPNHPGNLAFHAGPGNEVFNLYSRESARTFAEGFAAEGDDELVLLCRSGWAGGQRYGAALWSGDIAATFDSLRRQVRAGLNVAMSGVPWWTTDIGGFHGGDPDDPEFRELIVRWFQFNAFCPLFRLHGYRDPKKPFGPDMTGGPNEVWSFGDEAYEHITATLELRERLRPYLAAQLTVAHETGVPPMRPLFVDFPDDPRAWEIEDQFLLGPDVLVAPITEYRSRSRSVYLPAGADWVDPWSGARHPGGSTLEADAPLGRIPVFLRNGAQIPVAP